jgi:preprotein translocase subunit SecF
MSTRRIWYGLSIALILLSLGSLFTRGLNLGVDFTGGVTVQANFPQTATRSARR